MKEIMKRIVKIAGYKLYYILNLSLEKGIFPNELKEASVVSIPKVLGTTKIKEFGSINKLSVYEKILEIIVQKQLVEYLENNELLKELSIRFKLLCEMDNIWMKKKLMTI